MPDWLLNPFLYMQQPQYDTVATGSDHLHLRIAFTAS